VGCERRDRLGREGGEPRVQPRRDAPVLEDAPDGDLPYSKTYGALASGIVLLLWLNYSAFALLYGAELNSELDREAEIRAAGGPDAGLVKPSRRP
jgi:hypothetical protein